MGLSCTIYKIPVNSVGFLARGSPVVLVIHTNGTENFGRFGKSGKKGETCISEGNILLPEKFQRDELFHSNSYRKYGVFHTNDKRLLFFQLNHMSCLFDFSAIPSCFATIAFRGC